MQDAGCKGTSIEGTWKVHGKYTGSERGVDGKYTESTETDRNDIPRVRHKEVPGVEEIWRVKSVPSLKSEAYDLWQY
jgi:hypothetical protein